MKLLGRIAIAGLMLMGLLSVAAAFAQTRTPPAATTTSTTNAQGFTAASYASALNYAGTWSAASLTEERYDLIDWGATRSNHLLILGEELAAPGPGFSDYLGGLIVQPDLTNVTAKTNIPKGALRAYFSASAGVNLPSTGPSHIAALFGGTLSVQLNSNLSWQSFHVGYGRNGSQGFETMSTGLAYLFGGPKP